MPPLHPPVNANGEHLIRNLRDLQLDDELDYPSINTQTFDSKDSVHNQAQRIRKAEWIFVRLLQIWDPTATRDVQQLFPACDSKQSLDLRAAIFQYLSSLKKDGVFPKDLILRKTMFDECKGSKFEELLVSFSTSVLLKVLDRDREDCSAIKRLLFSEKSTDVSDLQLLELSYGHSLTHLLEDRDQLRRRWYRFGRVMKVKEDEIKQRRREHELKVEEAKQSRIPRRRLDRLQTHIERDWTGSSEWRSILLKSDQHLPDKSLLERPYNEVWHHASQDSLYHFRPEKARSSLQRLEYHIDKQNQRLAKWRQIQKTLDSSMAAAKPMSPPALNRYKRSSSPELGTTAYEQDTSNGHRRTDTKTPSPPRPQTAKRRSPNQSLAIVTKDLHDMNLDTERGSSAERISAREGRLRDRSGESSSKAHRRRSNTVIYSPHIALSSNSSMERLGEYDDSPTDEYDSSLELDEDATSIINSVLHAEPSPMKTNRPLSLTERARLSMAPNPATSSPVFNRARSISPTKPEAASQPRERPTSMSLDERTRQSMSMMVSSMGPPPQPESTSRPGTARRVTVTKRKSRSPEKRSYMPRPETPELTIVDESLLAESADEDTIFMSRPRIAHSPPLHPVSGSEEEEEEEEEKVVSLSIRDDESVEDFS